MGKNSSNLEGGTKGMKAMAKGVVSSLSVPESSIRVKVMRFSGGKFDTIGQLFIDGVKQVYTLEDEYRPKKVKGKTRIPSGVYELILREYGGHHEKYKKRYDEKFGEGWHVGMLELKGVDNFSHILIHIGNTHLDTEGCLLTGEVYNYNQNKDSERSINSSRDAYELIYPIIRDLILKETTYIEVIDEKKENRYVSE